MIVPTVALRRPATTSMRRSGVWGRCCARMGAVPWWRLSRRCFVVDPCTGHGVVLTSTQTSGARRARRSRRGLVPIRRIGDEGPVGARDHLAIGLLAVAVVSDGELGALPSFVLG